MHKRALLVGFVFVLGAVICSTAYANDGGQAWNDFWGGVGGFFYNALPWNWGNWMGQPSS